VFREPASGAAAASQRFSLDEEPADMSNARPDPDASRAETVMAALLYLMTHHARTGCPKLALCISRHMQCLALHPDAAPVVRQISASLHGVWQEAATGLPAASAGPLH
jgi:hypothetical protein